MFKLPLFTGLMQELTYNFYRKREKKKLKKPKLFNEFSKLCSFRLGEEGWWKEFLLTVGILEPLKNELGGKKL